MKNKCENYSKMSVLSKDSEEKFIDMDDDGQNFCCLAFAKSINEIESKKIKEIEEKQSKPIS